ncbi:MAG: hypothetical protein AB1489_14120 [Acidobacteriota bacterium]
MLSGKKLYFAILLLLVIALIGEQPRLKDDLKRLGTGLSRTLQVNEALHGMESFVDIIYSGYRNISRP